MSRTEAYRAGTGIKDITAWRAIRNADRSRSKLGINQQNAVPVFVAHSENERIPQPPNRIAELNQALTELNRAKHSVPRPEYHARRSKYRDELNILLRQKSGVR